MEQTTTSPAIAFIESELKSDTDILSVFVFGTQEECMAIFNAHVLLATVMLTEAGKSEEFMEEGETPNWEYSLSFFTPRESAAEFCRADEFRNGAEDMVFRGVDMEQVHGLLEDDEDE